VFVLELNNVGATACTLFQPVIELLPPSDPYNSLFLAASRSADEVGGDEYPPKQLQPGEWAHVLFAWTSQAAPEISCNHYSGLKLHLTDGNPNIPVEDRTAIEVRNLWIRSCSSVFVSGYRKGRYSPQSTIAAAWLSWWARANVNGSFFPTQPTAADILADSSALKLHAPVERIMLGDHLQLRLRFPRGADEGCAFRLLRKRESSGATIISVQQCAGLHEGTDAPAPRYLESGIARLEISALDLLPKEPGPVTYDVVGVVESSGSRPFGSAQVKLVARDPTLPAQAAILNPVRACKGSELRIDAPDAFVSTRLKTLRAYEATNISQEACSLGGVPELRFLREDGTDEPFKPKPCPNCDNDLFKTRPNGRIDLKPGGRAHFLAGTTAIDTQEDPWMHCQQTKSVELRVSAGLQPVVLPLDAALCAAIDISAWRPGAFDRDPQNTEWDKTHKLLLQDPPTPPPADCNKPGLLAMGRPSMMPPDGSVAWGLSLASHTFLKGRPVPLHLWIDNASDEAIGVWTCMELDYFKARGFDLYDAYGHRVLRRREVKDREECNKEPRRPRMEMGWSCTRNLQIPISAHTCVNGDNYDFTAQLAEEYELPPGEYTVHVREEAARPEEDMCAERQDAPFVITPGKDLTFEVVQP
jgi:hypothetical protein